jgi:hypothetical protein
MNNELDRWSEGIILPQSDDAQGSPAGVLSAVGLFVVLAAFLFIAFSMGWDAGRKSALKEAAIERQEIEQSWLDEAGREFSPLA